MMRLTKTVKQLLIINIIMFIGTSLSGDIVYSLFGLHFPKSIFPFLASNIAYVYAW